jgi:hypothetical protein
MASMVSLRTDFPSTSVTGSIKNLGIPQIPKALNGTFGSSK